MFTAPFLVIYQFLALSWWFWVFIIFLPIFASTWLYWRQEVWKHNLPFVVLELKMPREIRKSPRAMEQVLASISALRNEPADVQEKWWDGEITRWYSLEMVSFGGEIRFYMRVPRIQKNLVEAAILSYYPEVEVEEIEDYTNRLPANTREMHNQGYDLWGAEMKLRREDAYPIKTYVTFEAPEEEKQYDPISAFLEILAKVKKEEIVGIQFVVYPLSSDWKDKWQGLVEKLKISQEKGEKKKPKPRTATTFPGPANIGPLPHLEVIPAEKKQEFIPFTMFMRTPGETDVLKAVENNLSKPAFATQIRFVYLSPKSIFTDTYPRRGIQTAFNQYTALDLNAIIRNEKAATRVRVWHWPFLFPELRCEYRKQRMLHNYRTREILPQTVMGRILTSHLLNWNLFFRNFEFSTESLATLFHPPTYIVLTAPHIPRVESRKMGPPAGTPIFGSEEEIEKFR